MSERDTDFTAFSFLLLPFFPPIFFHHSTPSLSLARCCSELIKTALSQKEKERKTQTEREREIKTPSKKKMKEEMNSSSSKKKEKGFSFLGQLFNSSFFLSFLLQSSLFFPLSSLSLSLSFMDRDDNQQLLVPPVRSSSSSLRIAWGGVPSYHVHTGKRRRSWRKKKKLWYQPSKKTHCSIHWYREWRRATTTKRTGEFWR